MDEPLKDIEEEEEASDLVQDNCSYLSEQWYLHRRPQEGKAARTTFCMTGALPSFLPTPKI